VRWLGGFHCNLFSVLAGVGGALVRLLGLIVRCVNVALDMCVSCGRMRLGRLGVECRCLLVRAVCHNVFSSFCRPSALSGQRRASEVSHPPDSPAEQFGTTREGRPTQPEVAKPTQWTRRPAVSAMLWAPACEGQETCSSRTSPPAPVPTPCRGCRSMAPKPVSYGAVILTAKSL
jgi:hypothetical protein